MSSIIDFNSGKPKKGPKQETNTPPAGFREMVDAADLLFSDLPQHEMTFDAADAVKRRVSKLMLFTALVAQANEAIGKAGLDPAGFIVDEISLDLFITKDLPHVSQGNREDIEYFNGLFFEDDGDDRWTYRVATTVFEEDDGIGMAADVLRLDNLRFFAVRNRLKFPPLLNHSIMRYFLNRSYIVPGNNIAQPA